MFEQLMAKSNAKHLSTSMGASLVGKEGASSLQTQSVNPYQQVDTTDLVKDGYLKNCRHGRLDCPRFEGKKNFRMAYEVGTIL